VGIRFTQFWDDWTWPQGCWLLARCMADHIRLVISLQNTKIAGCYGCSSPYSYGINEDHRLCYVPNFWWMMPPLLIAEDLVDILWAPYASDNFFSLNHLLQEWHLWPGAWWFKTIFPALGGWNHLNPQQLDITRHNTRRTIEIKAKPRWFRNVFDMATYGNHDCGEWFLWLMGRWFLKPEFVRR
jgi:hypothetical protein